MYQSWINEVGERMSVGVVTRGDEAMPVLILHDYDQVEMLTYLLDEGSIGWLMKMLKEVYEA